MNAKDIEIIPGQVAETFGDLESRIMEDIVRRIRINGEITRSADWQITRLKQLGQSNQTIKTYIKTTLDLSDQAIENIYAEAVQQEYIRNTELYKAVGNVPVSWADNFELQTLINGVKAQTKGELLNITRSLGFVVQDGGRLKALDITKFYQQTLDSALNGIASGAFDYNTAIKKCVKEMTNSGLRWIDFESGYHNRVTVASRRAVMTGFNQTMSHINEQTAKDLGTDSFEVTWHAGARPDHMTWQGRVYTKRQLSEVCGLGTVAGLKGANCYHDYLAFVPGASVRTYTDAQLEKMNNDEMTPKTYNGKEYTSYEARQRQRQLETNMRAQRQEISLLKQGGGDPLDIQNAMSRYRGSSAEYTGLSKAMKLPQQRERVTVDGLGKVTGKIEVPSIADALTPDAVNARGTSILEKAYEKHRTRNNMTSTPLKDLGEMSPISADYSNISIKTSTAFNNTIERLSSEYDTSLYRIKTMSKEEAGLSDSFARVTHDYTTDTSELVINPRKCSDYEKFTNRISELSSNGYCASIPDELADQYIATHEFAHSLINMEIPLKDKQNWLGADYGKVKQTRKEVNAVFDRYTADISRLSDIQKKADLSALTSLEQNAWGEARKASEALRNAKISKRSMENADEFLAESFANEKIGTSSNPYAREVLEILDKYFKT